jgi:hypothetical protein
VIFLSSSPPHPTTTHATPLHTPNTTTASFPGALQQFLNEALFISVRALLQLLLSFGLSLISAPVHFCPKISRFPVDWAERKQQQKTTTNTNKKTHECRGNYGNLPLNITLYILSCVSGKLYMLSSHQITSLLPSFIVNF